MFFQKYYRMSPKTNSTKHLINRKKILWNDTTTYTPDSTALILFSYRFQTHTENESLWMNQFETFFLFLFYSLMDLIDSRNTYILVRLTCITIPFFLHILDSFFDYHIYNITMRSSFFIYLHFLPCWCFRSGSMRITRNLFFS